MSGTLRVKSLAEVEPDVAAAILADAQAFELEHDWWSEPLRVDAVGEITGDARLFLLGYEDSDGDWVDVDPDEDTFMAWHDMTLMIGRLVKWSAEKGVDFELFLEDDRLGTIEGGKVEAGLAAFVTEMGRTGGARGDPRRDKARAKSVYFRHLVRR